MNKKITIILCVLSLFVLTGCEKKCTEGYLKEGNACVKYTLNNDKLIANYSCETDWKLVGEECVNGEMPPMGDGCEEGTTDRIGEDGFCHHYKAAIITYTCDGNAVLKDGNCYIVDKK